MLIDRGGGERVRASRDFFFFFLGIGKRGG